MRVSRELSLLYWVGWRILKHTNLITLEWQWFYRSDLDDGNYMTKTIDLDKLSTDLSHVRQSLAVLTIKAMTSKGPTTKFLPALTYADHPEHRDLSWPKLTIKGNPNATFTTLSSLTYLQVPLVFLLGFSGATATTKIFAGWRGRWWWWFACKDFGSCCGAGET